MEAVKSSAECHSTTESRKNVKSKRREFAPLASFEDLEEFKPTKTTHKNCLPVIEDFDNRLNEPSKSDAGVVSEVNETKSKATRPETIRPIPVPVLDDSGSDNITPPTPRIDISCASSSSTISDEIPSSEKELRRYGLGLECSEEVEDLRSSTEEIAFEESSTPEGPLETKRIAIEALRRGSHPTNVFSRKISAAAINESFTRKPSVYSLHADAFSPRTGRHASFGGSSPRPKSCAPSPTPTCRSGRRSVSPHLMMFETSFCGNRPMANDLEAEVYAPEIITSQAQVHSSPACDKPHPPHNITQAQVNPPPTPRSPPSPPGHPPPVAGPSTSKSIFKAIDPPWSERFVIPNQPSLEEPDDESWDKVSLNNGNPLKCTKDVSTDFSDKDVKVDENISDAECEVKCDFDERRSDQGIEILKFVPPPNDISTPQETKGLFFDETLDDESNLPYVPTTLPLEKSVAVPIVPVKDRKGQFAPTTPIQRPRSAQPPNLTSIQDYISVNSHSENSRESGHGGLNRSSEKMKISLPKEESLGEEPKTPKKEIPKTWTDFAEMGLRNPRNLRRQVQEEFK